MAVQTKVFEYQEIKSYFMGAVNFFYKNAVSKYEEFLPHSDGKSPLSIINKQRPNEPDTVKAFRLDIWEPITKPTFSTVVSSLSKIRRSSDWSIAYPKDDFGRIREGDNLHDYCETKFPYFTSVTNWIFGVFLKQYLIDSNGVVLLMPLNIDIQETEFLEPFTYLYNSCNVIDFKEQEYAILNISEGCVYYDRKGKPKTGKSFYVVTAATIERYDQIDEKFNFDITYTFEHNLGFLPAFKNGGVICSSDQNNFLYESRISGVLPNLNEAIAEYTDLQAGKRLHIYPERWEFTQHECPKCKGTGLITNMNWKDGDDFNHRQIRCSNCHNGYIPSGPFSKMILKPTELGQSQIPTPPAGFIEKDINIIKLMDESIDKHIYKALSSINFQFLSQAPLNQSGVAKEVDKDELNNTVHSIAEDLVSMMDKIYKTIAAYRYKKLYNQQDINKMVPRIAVPEHFDLISSQYMQDEIKRSRDAKMNTILISEMEVEFSGKRFAQDDMINKIMRLSNILNPLPGATIEDKLAMSSNKTITREDNIISDNIISYIRRALFENEDFENWPLDKQQKLMLEYAEEQITNMSEASKMIADALQGSDFSMGDKVMVVPGMEHMPEHAGVVMTIAEIQNGSYAVKLPDGTIHKWYTADELQSANNKTAQNKLVTDNSNIEM